MYGPTAATLAGPMGWELCPSGGCWKRKRQRMRGSISLRHKLNLCPKRRRDVKVMEVLTGKFSFCWRAAFFFQSLSLSSATLLSMVAISPFFLFRFSLCCWSLALCSWFNLFLSCWKEKIPEQKRDCWILCASTFFNLKTKFKAWKVYPCYISFKWKPLGLIYC